MVANKIVIRIDGEESSTLYGTFKTSVLGKVLELRRWCYTNLKDPWRTYELQAASDSRGKYFIVFEFDSKKDEMLFRLYTGT